MNPVFKCGPDLATLFHFCVLIKLIWIKYLTSLKSLDLSLLNWKAKIFTTRPAALPPEMNGLMRSYYPKGFMCCNTTSCR